MKDAANKISWGKFLNCGQICLAPDYVFLPKNKLQDFIDCSKNAVSKMFPSIKDNEDYTSIINERHYDRLNNYINEAKSKGYEVIEVNPSEEDFEQQEHYKIPPTFIVNPGEELSVMKEEIFGPILP